MIPTNIIVITPPEDTENEAVLCNLLFDNGLERLHIRKPGKDKDSYLRLIRNIDSGYRKRIVVSDYYELVEEEGIGGIHLSAGKLKTHSVRPDICGSVSVSCHSFEEIAHLPFRPDYCFLSPVFDSISKKEYKAAFEERELTENLKKIPFPVIALGGITAGKTVKCLRYGFSGMGVLGYIWTNPKEAVQRFIRLKTPIVMSIGGFDPSSGAGITADIKTFEATGSYGLGVCTAITFQNQDEYEGTEWISWPDIKKQIEILLRKFNIRFVKIGIVENFQTIAKITRFLNDMIPDVRIVWDPVISSSSGHIFHDNFSQIDNILKDIHIITPNTLEFRQLFGNATEDIEKRKEICRKHRMNILWKGGHNTDKKSIDRLITPEDIFEFGVFRSRYGKHGTGCVLSAALTSYLAAGNKIEDACRAAQSYVSEFMDSNDSYLGYHFIKPAGRRPSIVQEAFHMQFITHPDKNIGICEEVEAVCKGGGRWIQLRMKNEPEEKLLETARMAAAVCRRYGAVLIIDDNVNVARQVNADGVHLGKNDMQPAEARKILGKDKIIGYTANTIEDILSVKEVDYIGLGPFKPTSTKENPSPVLGIQGYTDIINRLKYPENKIPIVAIGGIKTTDIPALLKCGIDGIAVSSGIINSKDISKQTNKILKIIYNETFENRR